MPEKSIYEVNPETKISSIKRAHVLSLSVKREVKSDVALGIVYGDVLEAAKQLSPLLKNLRSALDESKFPDPDGCQIRILEAEKSDATDFRVAVFLDSELLSDDELAVSAQALSQSLKNVFQWVASQSGELKTIDLFEPLEKAQHNAPTEEAKDKEPLNGPQQQLGIELSKIAKTVEFVLLDPTQDSGTKLKFLKRAPVEKNKVLDCTEVRGEICSIPKRGEIQFATADFKNFKVIVTTSRDQTLLALCFAVSFPVVLQLKKLQALSSRRKNKAQRFQLDKILSIEVTDPLVVDQARASIGALQNLMDGDLTLELSPKSAAGEKQTKKQGWGSRPRLVPSK